MWWSSTKYYLGFRHRHGYTVLVTFPCTTNSDVISCSLVFSIEIIRLSRLFRNNSVKFSRKTGKFVISRLKNLWLNKLNNSMTLWNPDITSIHIIYTILHCISTTTGLFLPTYTNNKQQIICSVRFFLLKYRSSDFKKRLMI